LPTSDRHAVRREILGELVTLVFYERHCPCHAADHDRADFRAAFGAV